ncbi:helix-turn-helix domain-containing protein [Lysobacter enzymogenes]|uniref:helix-turn-helix domain-containing protein n=1 Tax=Lysobacter enzymogenes TaxID=69 RepID=UPI00099BB8D2|nr:helix-turn-helix transcriptional regulator [Lysobacter enzymogenes]UZW62169.1 helix-turn-helix transcriptional regulator [Lysobacter enzymogenes]
MNSPARLVTLRKAKGYTLAALAETSGIHVQQIKRYELGNAQPSVEVLIKLAKTLAVTTDALLFNEDERAPSDDLALQFEAIAQFLEKQKQTVRALLEGLILKHQARRWNTPPRTAAR